MTIMDTVWHTTGNVDNGKFKVLLHGNRIRK